MKPDRFRVIYLCTLIPFNRWTLPPPPQLAIHRKFDRNQFGSELDRGQLGEVVHRISRNRSGGWGVANRSVVWECGQRGVCLCTTGRLRCFSIVRSVTRLNRGQAISIIYPEWKRKRQWRFLAAPRPWRWYPRGLCFSGSVSAGTRRRDACTLQRGRVPRG